MNQNTNTNTPSPGRVIGLDSHPDSFTTAVVTGQTPAQAVLEQMFNKVPMSQLQSWATKYTKPEDTIVLEASGNSFQVVRSLQAVGRQAKVLESTHLGKMKEAHANNDKISALRIAKGYLAGTTREVWVPDPKTQERRDWMHGHRKAAKRSTQISNRIQSFLSDNGVRLNQPLEKISELTELLVGAHQQQILAIYQADLQHAKEQRSRWVSLMAQEVLADPVMLSLVRMCGIREIVAFSTVAVIGDIKRFSNPKKLVKYVGLNPAFDDSGQEEWSGGIGGHGRRDLRSLLIESAQSIIRSTHPLAKWGKKLMARKGSYNLAVAAVARRLLVAIWYLMMGRWTNIEELDSRLSMKIGKIITRVGKEGLERINQTRQQLREQAVQSLKTGRVYVLDPDKKFTPQPTTSPTPTNSPKTKQTRLEREVAEYQRYRALNPEPEPRTLRQEMEQFERYRALHPKPREATPQETPSTCSLKKARKTK